MLALIPLEAGASEATPAAELAQTDVEHQAIIAISPKGQLDVPLVGFDIEIVQGRPFGMNRWRTLRVLAKGQTGRDGRAALAFQGPEVLHYEELNALPMTERLGFYARLCEPGYQERFVPLYRKDRQGNTGPFEATAQARPGGTIRGRLVNQDGQPVYGSLMFVRSADLHASGTPPRAGRCDSDPDGRFLLHVNATPDKDTDGKLRGACLAWSNDVGTGAISNASWPIDDLPQDLEITVQGPGALRGTVRDPSGRPAAGLDLILVRVDALARGSKAHFIGTLAVPFLLEDGLFSIKVRTDANGRFAAKGLSLADYAIHLTQGHPLRTDSSVTLTEEPVLADETELELTYEASGLVVQLLTKDGAPWPGLLSLTASGINRLPLPHDWPERPAVLAYPAERRAGAWVCASDDPNSRRSAKSLGGGAVQIQTGDARDLLVCVIGGNEQDGMFCAPPVHVAMEHGEASFAPAVFEAQTSVIGKLVVNAQILTSEVDLKKRKTVPHTASTSARLLVEHTATRMPLMEADHYGSAPYAFSLPPGSYTARAWNDLWACHHYSTVPIAHGAASAIVRPEQTTTMDLALDGGGKLVLQVKPGESSGTAGASSPYARLQIEYEDGRTLPVYHRHVTRYGPYDVRTGYSDAWAEGKSHSTTPLPLGRGRIRGRLSVTGREIDVLVEIVRGQPQTLEL